MKVEKLSAMSYSNQGINLPNALTVKDIDML
jgi:hypothetical protein